MPLPGLFSLAKTLSRQELTSPPSSRPSRLCERSSLFSLWLPAAHFQGNRASPPSLRILRLKQCSKRKPSSWAAFRQESSVAVGFLCPSVAAHESVFGEPPFDLARQDISVYLLIVGVDVGLACRWHADKAS
jgi:hypothetical protein